MTDPKSTYLIISRKNIFFASRKEEKQDILYSNLAISQLLSNIYNKMDFWNKPLSDKKLENILNDPNFYNTAGSDCSQSDVEDNVEIEPYEDFGSEYAPTDNGNGTDDSTPG
ncbi:hypothetical protein FQR65_LT11487 [Abscondita terminalis]|nr:hypothetical protein FQR65_LT11487 [Abscondita terminalis]